MRSLRGRLLASHLAVALVGVLALIAVGAILGGVLVERRVRAMRMMRADDARAVIAETVPTALAWGAAAAVTTAAILAVVVSRRIVEPLARIQEASHRIAAGDYSARAPRPPDAELAAVAADLDDLADRLADSEARRGRLIDEVAHEMRTPLTTIRGSMEGLIDEVIEPSPEVYERVAAEAARLQRLADDLSTLSRAEEHALSLRPERLDLGEIASQAVERLRPQFEHADVALSVAPAPAAPALADRDRVMQILVNLLGNALAHTPAGGSVRASVSTVGDRALVSVADSGRGLADEELERVFERFYRGGGAGTAAGRGIGLTIARSLARAHGGDVTAASPGPGRGSTFTLSLPREA